MTTAETTEATATAPSTLEWKRTTTDTKGNSEKKVTMLKLPTLDELLKAKFKERQHLLFPWLREQESCMVYADTGVGKSLFALSAALAVAGGGSFLGWKADKKAAGDGWRVLYIDGEMHIADIQERAAMLLETIPGIDKELAGRNLRFLARQHQEPGAEFPLITTPEGMKFYLDRVKHGSLDLVILDNFTTLGEVEDENSAASFNAIQEFLLQLKTSGVATILVHHAGKSGDFRGSSKLAATFETIIKLEHTAGMRPACGEAQFRVRWDKVRSGGPKRAVRAVIAKLITDEPDIFGGPEVVSWVFDETDLNRLDEIRAKLQAGDFVTQKEIGDFFGVTKVMAGKYVDKGKRLGMWDQEDLGRWFAKGKHLRSTGARSAPVKPLSVGDYLDPAGDEGEAEGGEQAEPTAF